MPLQVPHKVQQTMSREQTPVLAGTLPAFEMFMSTWELLGEKHPRLEPFINIGLSWARKHYCHMDQTRAVEPLERTSQWETGEFPETYPFAV